MSTTASASHFKAKQGQAVIDTGENLTDVKDPEKVSGAADVEGEDAMKSGDVKDPEK